MQEHDDDHHHHHDHVVVSCPCRVLLEGAAGYVCGWFSDRSLDLYSAKAARPSKSSRLWF